MQRFRTTRSKPGRGPARWTFLELIMLVVAILMIVFPLYTEASRWVNPLVAPAAPRPQTDATNTGAIGDQRATQTPVDNPTATDAPTATTDPGATATQTSAPTATTDPGATATSTSAPTATTDPGATATQTSAPTATTDPGATATSAPTASQTSLPTSTPVPGTPTATLTPVAGEPPLRLVKSSTAGSVSRGQQFEYTLSVFSNSASSTSVRVDDTIDQHFTIVGTRATKGTCAVTGSQVSCSVPVQNNQPVTIGIIVKARGDAQPGRVPNQALAQDDRSFTAASDVVNVDVVDSGSAPTSGPSPTSGPAPTEKPTSKPGGGGGGGSAPTPLQPTSPLLPPLPPTPRPGAARPTARPGARATPVRAGSTATATSVPVAPTATPVISDLRMRSDWGSAFTGQEIEYQIELRNLQKTGDFKNVQITSALPDNLQIIGQSADPGEVKVQNNFVSLSLASLEAQKTVIISVRAKIKDTVEIGTRLVSQAEATYDGLAQPLRSNIVTVLIVGGPVVQAATPAASATAAPTATPVATATTVANAVPTATSTTKPPLATPTPAPAPQLPNTSGGVPISGFALLGLTLLLRTVRIHRAQTRI